MKTLIGFKHTTTSLAPPAGSHMDTPGGRVESDDSRIIHTANDSIVMDKYIDKLKLAVNQYRLKQKRLNDLEYRYNDAKFNKDESEMDSIQAERDSLRNLDMYGFTDQTIRELLPFKSFIIIDSKVFSIF